MRRLRVLITLVVVALASVGAGCASGGSSAVTPAGASRYLVTQQELAGMGDRSAYDALEQIRPAFLRSRDIRTTSKAEAMPVDVFVDGGRTEGLDALKNIRVSTVKEIRFYEPQDANTRFGTGHNGGVIAVTLK